VIPLFLFQIASHIFQAIGDYESDKEEGIRTFVVKYGKEKSAKIGAVSASLSLVLPLIYGLVNIALSTEFVYWYLLLFLVFLPFVIYLLRLSLAPTKKNISVLMGISRRFTPFMLVALFALILMVRFYLG